MGLSMTDKAGLTLPLKCITPLGPVPRILISGWALIISSSLSSQWKASCVARKDLKSVREWQRLNTNVKPWSDMQEAVGLTSETTWRMWWSYRSSPSKMCLRTHAHRVYVSAGTQVHQKPIFTCWVQNTQEQQARRKPWGPTTNNEPA